MRLCLRCKEEMLEDLEVKVEAQANGLKITEVGIFKESLGKIKCVVCPNCGYVEPYIKKSKKLMQLKENKQRIGNDE